MYILCWLWGDSARNCCSLSCRRSARLRSDWICFFKSFICVTIQQSGTANQTLVTRLVMKMLDSSSWCISTYINCFQKQDALRDSRPPPMPIILQKPQLKSDLTFGSWSMDWSGFRRPSCADLSQNAVDSFHSRCQSLCWVSWKVAANYMRKIPINH